MINIEEVTNFLHNYQPVKKIKVTKEFAIALMGSAEFVEKPSESYGEGIIGRFDGAPIEIDDDIESDPFPFLINIKTVKLKDMLVIHDESGYVLPHLHELLVRGIIGINADGRNKYAGILEDLLGNVPRQRIDLIGRHSIVDFDMKGTQISVRTVIMEHDIVNTVNLRKRENALFDLPGIFALHPVTEHIVNSLKYDLDTCFKDEERDYNADIGFDVELEQHQDDR